MPRSLQPESVLVIKASNGEQQGLQRLQSMNQKARYNDIKHAIVIYRYSLNSWMVVLALLFRSGLCWIHRRSQSMQRDVLWERRWTTRECKAKL